MTGNDPPDRPVLRIDCRAFRDDKLKLRPVRCLHFSAAVRIKEKRGVFERGLGPVRARKLKPKGSEQGVEKQGEHEPPRPSSSMRERDGAPDDRAEP